MPARNTTNRRPPQSPAATARHDALVAAVVDSVVLALGLDAQDILEFLETHETLTRAVATAIGNGRAIAVLGHAHDDS
jgi:hypothetical protein